MRPVQMTCFWCSLVREASGSISICTVTYIQSNVFQTFSAGGVRRQISLCLDGCWHLFSCDVIAQDVLKEEHWMTITGRHNRAMGKKNKEGNAEH